MCNTISIQLMSFQFIYHLVVYCWKQALQYCANYPHIIYAEFSVFFLINIPFWTVTLSHCFTNINIYIIYTCYFFICSLPSQHLTVYNYVFIKMLNVHFHSAYNFSEVGTHVIWSPFMFRAWQCAWHTVGNIFEMRETLKI